MQSVCFFLSLWSCESVVISMAENYSVNVFSRKQAIL